MFVQQSFDEVPERRRRALSPHRLGQVGAWALAFGALIALGVPSAAQSQVAGWGVYVVDGGWNQEVFAEVAAGSRHTVARRPDGSVVAWGDNWAQQCEVPPFTPGLAAVGLDGGFKYTLALLSDGSLVSWGRQRLWPGNRASAASRPHLRRGHGGRAPLSGTAQRWLRRCLGVEHLRGMQRARLPAGLVYVEIAAGVHRGARSDGSRRRLGVQQRRPVQRAAPPAGLAYVEVAAGHYHTVARRSDGSVVAWGQQPPASATSRRFLPA